jgi:long-chain fatty acid transport protein
MEENAACVGAAAKLNPQIIPKNKQKRFIRPSCHSAEQSKLISAPPFVANIYFLAWHRADVKLRPSVRAQIDMIHPLKKFLGLPLLLAAVGVQANGLRVASEDAEAAARGNAFTATADNPSAVYYNPAGLTQISGTQLRGGIYALSLDPTFTPPATAPNAGHTYRVDKHYAFIPQGFFAHSFSNSPVSVGFGMYAPYGGGIGWPNDSGFRAVATRGSTTYLRFNPAVAVKICKQVSLGAGVSADWARLNVEQGLRPLAAPLANDFRFTGEGWTFGYNAGVLWQPVQKLSFGATVRSSTRFELDGETAFQQQPVISPTVLPASAGLEFPLTATFGVSYRPSEKWNLEFDADYADWSSVSDMLIRQHASPPFPVQQNIPVKLRWHESWMYEAGVTHYFDNGWRVSAGYTFSENSVPDSYYTPLAADLDRHFISLGIGHRGKKIDLDITYQFGYGPGHTVSGSQPSSTPGLFAGQNADGTYEFISHAVLVSTALHF